MPGQITKETIPGFVQKDIPLNNYTTWNIGGPARYFCEPGSIGQLRQGINFARSSNIDWTVIGNGSNILAPDMGFDGLVIRLGPEFSDGFVGSDDKIELQSGAPLYNLADIANDYGCTCFNFVTGIPGTIGGAVTMNAGAFGHEVSDYLEKVIYLGEFGRIRKMLDPEAEFSYRSSPFQGNDRVILGATFKLDFSDRQPSMKEILATRRSKLPYSGSSAGSVFKNPTSADKTAGEMLDIVGAKGMNIGDAVVSHQHANFIINKGRATAENVQNLIDILLERVYKEFGVTLVTEIEVI